MNNGQPGTPPTAPRRVSPTQRRPTGAEQKALAQAAVVAELADVGAPTSAPKRRKRRKKGVGRPGSTTSASVTQQIPATPMQVPIFQGIPTRTR